MREKGCGKEILMHMKIIIAHLPTMGSDDPPPSPLGVENVKILKNSEKSGEPLQLFLGH